MGRALPGGVAAVTASGPANAAATDGLGSNWYASAPYLRCRRTTARRTLRR
ncbi:hypothetical protein [Kitasatospora griseola]|uniref:hypothetical protein n=1 Tax=Kitasatospora griseola TaxID=2064 RepID=UPI003F4DA4AB